MPISLRFGNGDAHITVTAATGEILSFGKRKNPGTRMHCSVLMVCLRKSLCALIINPVLPYGLL